MKSNLYNAAYRSCTVGTQLAFAACGTQLSARLTRPQPLPWTVCPLTWKALIFFYILALECIRDLAVVCVVMSFAPITVPGVQEYSWSKRMKEFIFQKKKKKTQWMCKSSNSGYMVYDYKMRTLDEHLKKQCLFSFVRYIMSTSAVT